jgi:uncharacterized protein (TIGR03067 family)
VLWVVLAAAVPALAADGPKDEDAIQGVWTVVSREVIGKKTPADELKGGKIIIKDGTMTSDDGKKKEMVASYKLDPSKSPKAMDLTNATEDKLKSAAIYELDGDTLKICWSEKVPDQRPTKFTADADSGQTMIVLKREKK